MIATSSAPFVIDIQGVTRRFGATVALENVSLRVPRGVVFGLIGANGSGKTTLLKHVLGLLQAESGTVRVFERDPVADPVGVLSRIGYLSEENDLRIGYLSEENDLPPWMTVAELIRYTKAFYPGWRDDYAEELRRQFGLDLRSRIDKLSKGQKARAGLLAALAYRPELLVFDEPSSGLDPLVRRDILGAIIRTVADEGRTVLFSSHLLDEMERVVDSVAMIDKGRIVFAAAMDDLQAKHCRLTLRFAEARQRPPELLGALSWEGAGQEWAGLFHGAPDELRAIVSTCGAHIVEEQSVGLDEIFVARMRQAAAILEQE
jgi:ABC-2 type transport system ATP-binding protein